MSEQLALLDAESDEALLLPAEVVRKRYTARQVEKIEARLDCIVTMLAWGIPQEKIAQAAHVNHRTLTTIAGRYAERVGKDALSLADYAAGKAAKFLYLADQKAEGASAKDLAIMHGIVRDTMINCRATAGATDLDNAIEVEQSNEKLEAFREKLKLLKPGTVNNAGTKEQRIENAEVSGVAAADEAARKRE